MLSEFVLTVYEFIKETPIYIKKKFLKIFVKPQETCGNSSAYSLIAVNIHKTEMLSQFNYVSISQTL